MGRNFTKARIIIIGAILILFGPITYADIYKWVDKDGNIHYGDKPLDRDKATKIKIKDKAPNQTANDGSANTDQQRRDYQKKLLEVMQSERKRKQEEKAKIKQEKLEAQQKCQKARKNLREYLEAAYLYDQDENGERVILSDEKRSQATADARAAVAKWCK